jgi:hypothetical protein
MPDRTAFPGQLYALAGFELITVKGLPGAANGRERAKVQGESDGITFNGNNFSVRGNNGKGFRPGKDYRVGGTFSRHR